MDDRFRVDGEDLGVDLTASFGTVDQTGIADATIVAAAPAGAAGVRAAPVRLVITGIPLRFDGEAFGATVDAELRDRLFVEALAEGEGDEGGDPDGPDGDDQDRDDQDRDDLPAFDPGVVFHAGSRVDADGRLTHAAGDRLRFVGEVALPGVAAPLRLDISLGLDRRRRPRV